MRYIENIVIGTPIADPKDMFANSDDDWNAIEKEKNILYRRTFHTTNSCRSWSISFNKRNPQK